MTEWLCTAWNRLRALARQRQLDNDLGDEMDFHLAMREAQLRETGSPDAPAGARRRFGNVTTIRSSARDAWIEPWFQDASQDARFAVRRLVKDRWFMLTAVLTLAVGMGMSVAVFAVVNAVLLADLPFPEPDRMMTLWAQDERGRLLRVSGPDYEDWRTEMESFSGLAAFYGDGVNVGGGDRATERAIGAYVSAGLFEMFNAVPTIGRGFAAADDQSGAESVAVIGDRLWRTRYDSDPTALGRPVRVNGEVATIVGVMPPDVAFPVVADIWMPRVMLPTSLHSEQRDVRLFEVYGRLTDGVSVVLSS